MRRFLLILTIFLLTGCYFTNVQVVNVPDTFKNLKSKTDINSNDPKKIIKIKHVYKLKNGMVIDQYRKSYGYWYRIRRGDSLFRIAKRTGTTIRKLARVNRISRKKKLTYKAFLFIPLSERYLKRKAEVIPVALREGDFIWPLYGRITSGFGLRRWGWRKKFHKGTDIAAPVGTKIICSRKGEVTFAGRKRKYGKIVIMKHGEKFETRYAHLQKILVKKGDTVAQGDLIGLVGKTGRATGYHLHFEIRINNYPVNPEDYLPKEVDSLAKMLSPYKKKVKTQ